MILCFFAGTALCSLAVQPRTFELHQGTVRLEVPNGWQDAEMLFGVPLTILGPEQGGARPVLNVTATDKVGVEFDPKELKSSQADYQEGRKKWLSKYKGKALEFFAYEKREWEGITEAHSIGYRYRINNIEFVERSYYVLCKDRLFHLKSLLRSAHEKSYAGTVERMVRSFTCL